MTSLDNLYKAMKEELDMYYQSGRDETITINVTLFFRLFRLVCDMMQIYRIIDSQ